MLRAGKLNDGRAFHGMNTAAKIFSRPAVAILGAFAASAFFSVPAFALSTVQLKNGSSLRGDILAEKDNPIVFTHRISDRHTNGSTKSCFSHRAELFA